MEIGSGDYRNSGSGRSGQFSYGRFVRGGTGFAIAGALLLYLLRPEVRAVVMYVSAKLYERKVERLSARIKAPQGRRFHIQRTGD
jgi:hypothetical protein